MNRHLNSLLFLAVMPFCVSVASGQTLTSGDKRASGETGSSPPPVTSTQATDPDGLPDSSASTTAASKVAFAQQPKDAKAGAIISPAVTVRLKNIFGKNVEEPDVAISLTISSGTGMLSGTTTRLTNDQGIATFDDLSIDLIGSKRLRASSTGLQSAISKSFDIKLGSPARLLIQVEPSERATAGDPFAQQPIIWVVDAGGNLVTGDNSTVVTASRLDGSGALQGSVIATARRGIVSYANLSHNIAGTITVLFTSGALIPDTSTAVLVEPASAARLAFLQQPTNTTAGAVITPPITVRLKDAFGNDVKTSGTSVTIALSSGSGTLGGTLTRNTSSGVATFNNLSIDLTGSKKLTVSSGSLSAAVSESFTISAQTPVALVFIQQPTNTDAAAPITPAVTVQLRDSLGNDVPLAGANVTLQLAVGIGTLSGTSTRTTDAKGLATFDDLSIDKAGQKRLRATGAALTSVLSSSFVVTAAQASKLAFVQQPTSTTAGQNITPAVTVQLRDALGNNVPTSGVSVLMALTAGSGGTLSGTTTQLTDASGLATFSNLSIDLVGIKSLTAIASGLDQPQSVPFAIYAAAPSKLVFTGSPSSSTAGAPFPTQPVISLQDQYHNVVNGVAQDVTIAIQMNAGQDGVLTGLTTIPVDTSTGVAHFDGLAIDKSGIGYTLTATGSTVSTIPGAVVSSPFDVTAASPSQVRVETEADGSGTLLGTQVVSSGTAITVYAIARDTFDNFVSNAEATSWSLLELTGGVEQSDLVPSADRRNATFTGAAVGSAVINVDVTGLNSVPSGVVTVANNAKATKILVETAGNGAGSVVEDQTVPSGSSLTVYAVARDLNDNFVANVAADDWSLVDATGGVTSGDLVPSGDQRSATLTGRFAGTTRIQATLRQLIPTLSGTITVTFGRASVVSAMGGTPQSTIVGTPFGTRLSAIVTDAAGNLVSEIPVTFDAPSVGASGSFEAGTNTVVTNASGVALAPVFTANFVAGTYSVTASVSGALTVANFELTNSPRAVGRITAAGGTPQSTQVGTTFPTRLAASVQDSFGNPVVGADVTFAAPATGTSGTFPGGVRSVTSTTDSSGVSTAPDFTADLTVGTYSVTASAPGVGSPALFVLTNRSGSAATIAPVAGSRQSAEVNTPFSTNLGAVVTDASGNAVSGVLVTFSTPQDGPSGAFTWGGTINVATDTNGVAAAPLLVANMIAGTFNVVAYAQGVETPAEFELTNRPGPVSSFLIEAKGGGAIATQAVRVPFDIRIVAKDGFENIATAFTGTVTLSSSGALAEGGGITPAFVDGILAEHTVSIQNAGGVVLFALRTGGAEPGQSNTFKVNNPAPEVTGVTPSAGAKGESLTLTVTGAGFLQGVTQVLLGDNITTYETVASDSQITVELNIGLGALDGPRPVLVINPPPGGGIVSVDSGFTVEGLIYPTAYTLQNTIVFPSYTQNSDFQGTDYRIVGMPGAGDVPISQFLAGAKDQDWVVFWDNGASSNYLVSFDGTSTFSFSAGRAFWVLHKGPLVMNVTVPSVPLDSANCVSIPLHAGWNLITNPFTMAVAWSDVQSANLPDLLGGVYTFDGSFAVPDVLSPSEGYLYDNTGNLTSLVIPFREGRLRKQDPSPEGAWNITVELKVGEYVERLVSFGVLPEAEKGRDGYDFRRPRGVALLPEVYFDHPEWGAEGSAFATDIRPLIRDLDTWQMDVRATPQEPVQLSFGGVSSVQDQYRIVLVDDTHRRSVDLSAEPVYQFTPATRVTHFRIAVGTEGAVAGLLGDILPKEFELGNNFPNPFNPSTTIPITIPWRSRVSLRVYTILGEVVRTLYDGSLAAGRHYFEWDGTSNQGRSVSAGVYFIQLTSESGQRFIRKMVLLK